MSQASKIGYYVPLLLAGTVLSSVACGLVSRFYTDTSDGYWYGSLLGYTFSNILTVDRIGSLILFGIGIGIGAQQAILIPQVVLTGKDVPLGTSAIIFVQTLFGTIFLSVGQNVFQDRLVRTLQERVPRVDPKVVIDSGAADLAQTMSKLYPQDVQGILVAYAEAIRAVFLVALVLSCLSIFGSALCEWKSVKKENGAAVAHQKEKVSDEESEKV